jgi:Protein of unknown function (DUF1176)
MNQVLGNLEVFVVLRFILVLGLLISSAFAAVPLQSVSFEHKDWELACDNTRTCRAAGYQAEESGGPPVSMLLTRQAGANTPVMAEVLLGEYDEATSEGKKAATQPLFLRINGQSIGGALVWRDNAFALTAHQVKAVLSSLGRSSRITLHRGEMIWTLSDQGATAVLLKMDEFQGRLNTPGALMRKGPRSESIVLAAVPVPVVVAAPLAQPLAFDTQFVERNAEALKRAVGVKKAEEVCTLWSEEREAMRFAVTRLTANKLLLTSPCWRGAYNAGDAYWVINDRPPFQPQLITESGTDFSHSTLTASHKERGLGDCWTQVAWTWDGQKFVKTAQSTTGMCRLVAAGGTWNLPTLVTEIKRQEK